MAALGSFQVVRGTQKQKMMPIIQMVIWVPWTDCSQYMDTILDTNEIYHIVLNRINRHPGSACRGYEPQTPPPPVPPRVSVRAGKSTPATPFQGIAIAIFSWLGD